MADIETVDLELVADVTVACVALSEPETPLADPDASGRRVAFVVDKPPVLGGTDRGAMPSEYFAAAIASCTMMTARRIAAKRKVTYRALRCRALIHLEGADITRVVLRLAVTSDGSAAEWATVFRLAEKGCTISRATRCPIEHEITVHP